MIQTPTCQRLVPVPIKGVREPSDTTAIHQGLNTPLCILPRKFAVDCVAAKWQSSLSSFWPCLWQVRQQ